MPLGQLSREFVDAAGWLHQVLAERADSVTLAIAGLPLTVK
ncbi:bifunctional adenosylcobinamide kinase/adenosylcobinamide-phosphate guanylyltransferase [Microbulbifer sp. 2304DJ12-6]